MSTPLYVWWGDASPPVSAPGPNMGVEKGAERPLPQLDFEIWHFL